MRSAATFFVTIIVGILTIVMVITMTGRMNRSTEIRSNTDSAAEDTVYSSESHRKIYSIK